MMKRYDLIVFDWDGTLIDSADAISSCIQLAARDLGLAVPDAARARHVIGLGLPDALAHAIPALEPERVDDLIDRYRHHFLARDAELPLFPGTDAMLESLRERGHLLAIATGKSAAGLARALAHARLGHLFDATRCADQSTPKPAPDMLVELIGELGVLADRTLMVGDTTHDLAMAHAAGVEGLAVTHGAHARGELEQLPSIGIVDSTSELAAWLAANA